MRARTLVLVGVAMGLAGIAVFAAQEAIGDACGPRSSCHGEVDGVRASLGFLSLLLLLLLGAPAAWVWALPADKKLKPRLGWGTVFVVLAGVWGLLLGGVLPEGLIDALAVALLLALGALVAAGMRLALLAPPGSPARARNLRIALALLAVLLLVQPVSVVRWWSAVPEGLTWTLDAGQVCGERQLVNGSVGTCMGLSQLAIAPLLVLAAATAGLHAAWPRRRAVGWTAIGLVVACALLVVGLNFASAGSNDWSMLTLAAGGLALTSWLLSRELRAATPG